MTEVSSPDQVFINRLTEIVLANLEKENFGVDELANEAGLTTHNLRRRLHKATNKNIAQFIREIRLLKSLELLKNEKYTAAEVAYKTGFSSPTYFNTCFHEYFGFSPGEVKKGNIKIPVEKEQNRNNKKIYQIKRFWKRAVIASLIIFFLLLLIITGFNKQANNDFSNNYSPNLSPVKSVAVLPFKNLGENTTDQYFIEGVMEDILTNLGRIHNLRVISWRSVENLRNSGMTSAEISRKLDVDYIVEGSGQKFGNKLRLRVQLIEAYSNNQIWAESYDHEILSTEAIFKIQSEVAQKIASALNTKITPEEKRLIEKNPTVSLTAYDFYQRGREEHSKSWIYLIPQKTAFQKAAEYYRKAVNYDSTFAQAYTGLAKVYWDMSYNQDYLSDNFLDSTNILCDIALSYDPDLPDAYTLKGMYYSEIGQPEKAIEEFDKAIELDPNDWRAYRGKGEFYDERDFINSISNYQKALALNHGPELPELLIRIGWVYFAAGFPEKSNYFYLERLKLDGDSATYYGIISIEELFLNDFKKAIEFGLKSYAIDTTNYRTLLWLAQSYSYSGKYQEALKIYEKFYERSKLEGLNVYDEAHRVAYAYWKNGNKEKAEHYFNEQLYYCNRLNELGRKYKQSFYSYYDLAAIYAFRGEKELAYKNLRILNKKQMMPMWIVNLIKNDPFFDSIRNEPEFQKIVGDIESKYQAEHKRVLKWLEEKDSVN